MKKTVSIIVPAYNEEQNIPFIYDALKNVTHTLPQYEWELVFVNDGSTDRSDTLLTNLAALDSCVQYIDLSRNFGKEMATTAGIHEAIGDALIMIDADLQHPPELIAEFVTKWEAGAEVVVGVRSSNTGEGLIKKWGSLLFYRIMSIIAESPFEQGETDYRLLDRIVIDAYKQFPEHQRMTRSLVNWLGFKRDKVEFVAAARQHGVAQYSTIKLMQLALNSFLSHSLAPLRLAGYLGVTITLASAMLGVVVILEKYILHDPFGWAVSGSAQLAILNVFLVGIVLASLGIVGLYVGSIHTEAQNRPLYVVRSRSKKL